MNDYFELENNFTSQEEYIPGMVEFYRNYAKDLLAAANIKLPGHLPSFAQMITPLKQLALSGDHEASSLLIDIYREGLVGKAF